MSAPEPTMPRAKRGHARASAAAKLHVEKVIASLPEPDQKAAREAYEKVGTEAIKPMLAKARAADKSAKHKPTSPPKPKADKPKATLFSGSASSGQEHDK